MNRPTAKWFLIGAAVVAAAVWLSPTSARSAPTYGYEVLAVHPHDAGAYTEGLLLADDLHFYESTGLYGQSSIRKVEIESGQIVLNRDLDSQYFGEGLTALRDTLYQLTWVEHHGFSYLENGAFQRIEDFPYPWEGWGLTTDGTHLIASDGSDVIRFLDPRTRQEVRQIQVRDGSSPIDYVNELEWIHGTIFANIWFSDEVAVIDPSTGQIDAWLDLGGLRDSLTAYPNAEVLNGIAYDAEGSRLFVTGKRWPKLFQIDTPLLHTSGVSEPGLSRLDGGQGSPLRIVPNPCTRSASILLSGEVSGPVRAAVFDVSGRVVRRIAIGAAAVETGGERMVPLRLDGLSPGRYFVQVDRPGRSSIGTLAIVR